MFNYKALIISGIFLLSFCVHGSLASQRAIWVTRWDFSSPEDVIKIIKNAKSIGTDTILFQVRGNATAFYPSKIEPWSWELTSDSSKTLGKEPGWDPLGTAVAETKKAGLELHAWVNVFPAWRGEMAIPKGIKHPWVDHRDWFMVDQQGSLLRPSSRFYTFLSPGHPEVKKYLADVFREIAANYPGLDGIHMDYVRYPAHKEINPSKFQDFSHDSESIRSFQREYGKKPRHDMAEWMLFKRNQVSETIQGIHQAINSVHPGIQLSATFVAEIEKAHTQTGQDPERWLSDGIVEWVVPMAYKRSTDAYVATLTELDAVITDRWRSQMAVGINASFSNMSTEVLINQVQYALQKGYRGVAIFAYSSLFPNHKANSTANKIKEVWVEDILKDVLKGQ